MAKRYWFRKRGVFLVAITSTEGYIAYLALTWGSLVFMPQFVLRGNPLVKTLWFLLWIVAFNGAVLLLGKAKDVNDRTA